MAEGRRGGGTGGGGGGDDESSAGSAVELSLRLRTGAVVQEEEAAARTRRRSMTIFYNGRVCAVDVTELQARAIISMANQENLTEQQRRDHDRHHHQDDSSSDSVATAQCGAGSGHQNPTPPSALLLAAHCQASPASPRQGLEAAAAAPLVNHAATGLSMKRSLQRFLQKRKTRAAAVASPYAGGRPAQPMRPC